MNDLKEDLLMQLFQNMGVENFELPSFHGMPEIPDDMHPFDVIISMRHLLPPHEQKIVDLMVKLNEVKELMDEIHGWKK